MTLQWERPTVVTARVPEVSALEADFPSVSVSRVAEAESWRKEVHRPATHTHKWWAQRLGSVFRSILTASVSESGQQAEARYVDDANALRGLVVLDPFAGSGTTLFEVAKLGGSPIGFDINPVASLVQRQALQQWDSAELGRGYRQIEEACRAEIDRLHRTASGDTALYYFWVAVASCPVCSEDVRLFSRQVFAQHAYAKKYPKAQAVCPTCLAVKETTFDFETETCENGHTYTNNGAVAGANMRCPNGHTSKVVEALGGKPPRKEMYAKLVATPTGSKYYSSADQFDRDLADEASALLASRRDQLVQPVGVLEAGYNTRQAMSWGFKQWGDFFNDRQLYCLGLIATAIRDLRIKPAEREALAALFSGTLEFNNQFCSFKGEGTGAVRHMFSHHILKPERMVLEAHPWGTPWSSGSFSTLYKSRLQRAHEHKLQPFDLVLGSDGATVSRLAGAMLPDDLTLVSDWPAEGLQSHQALIRPADSSASGLPDKSVDLVVTDPPYMDNVHYSELADFFHAWLRGIHPFEEYPDAVTTRADGEVQSTTADGFGRAIERVWAECRRVMKDDGLLAFTFHQARIEGWVALVKSLAATGWQVTAVQPVTGEMSTSITKSGVKEPSSLDSVVVCRPRMVGIPAPTPEDMSEVALDRLVALRAGGVKLGPGDVRSVVRGSVLAVGTFEQSSLSVDDLVLVADRLADEAIHAMSLKP